MLCNQSYVYHSKDNLTNRDAVQLTDTRWARTLTEPESMDLSPVRAYRTIDLNGKERLAEFNKSFGYLWRFQRTDWNYSQRVQKIKWHYFRGYRWYFIPGQDTIFKSGKRKSINIEILWLLLSQNWWPTMDRRCPVDDGRESNSSRRILFLWRIHRFWNLFLKTENESDWSPYLSLQYYFVDHGMTHFNDSCHILFHRIPTVKLKILEKAFMKSETRISVTFKL